MKEPKIRGRRTPPPYPGGKALGRLQQFEEQRGLPSTTIEPKRARGKPGKGKRRPR